ncbi:CubicO group peptidase, beta-lactamase class C family [Sphingomonas sp. NFR04]|uniref:serine hydrolase domain-containing protein n=1 Tax=Sphingomonas sp. NFR04 TaxID=1566283 RepID=UPI0008ED633D|nr:serine hydrolase domain-containing protein [Sphingomonas sp. NFR04]SFK05957.1 CubicO group peptidase, beta-lactamase class C family [Sphingomonas sp. NFR04]
MKKPLIALLATLLVAATQVTPPPVAPPAAPAAHAAPAPTVPAPTPQLTEADVGAWLDGYMPAALKAGKIAGAQVAIVKDGAVLFEKGYGYADVAAKTPMDPRRSLMRIGSTSKLLTWTAVMQLVEAGRIDLNADVNRYLDFRITPPGRPVTINDLMQHRGGFEEGLKDLLASDPKLLKTTERYLKENTRPFLFAPGEAPAYSNYGVALAGYIVQRVSGEPFEAYVARHITGPLGMAHTSFAQPLPPQLAPLAAKGYATSDGPAQPYELVGTAPAGSVATTADDMARFMLMQLGGGSYGGATILKPATTALLHQPSTPPVPGFDTMAHGFFWMTRNGTPVIGHGGDTIVFHTDLNLLPEKKVGIFVSFSSRGENDAVYGVRERLFDLFMDRYFPASPVPMQPAIASAAQDAQALAGHYESTRRVETGFISLFYLLQQDQVTANPDGTIGVSSIEGKRFREVAKGLWREVDGNRLLRVTELGGRRAIVDSQNPVGVLQAVPFSRNSTVFQSILGLSLLVLVLAVLMWPVGWWIRRRFGAPPAATGRAASARLLVRVGAIADLAYLAGWYAILAPILGQHVDAYNATLDTPIRLLQIAAIVPVAAAGVGVWNLVEMFRQPFGWGMRVRAALVALALLGILWVAAVAHLIGWSLNY